jgi:hypothetical protein
MKSRASTSVRTAALLAFVLAAAPGAASAQTSAAQSRSVAAAPHDSHELSAPSVAAAPRSTPIARDGALDDDAWASAAPATGFIQNDPTEGEPATQQTEVRFLYDADALYVGARMYDAEGAAGVRTGLARRDQNPGGDYLELIFDTFHDHNGRTVFRINPSGVKYDAGQASPSADPSWDPVWQAATRIDSAGWTAELRIPWSQLRFPRDSVITWGLQVTRFNERLNERSSWAFWTKDEAGGPSRFGHLREVRIQRRPGGWEIMPYTVARAAYVEPTQPGSPFQQSSSYDVRAGADVKALLGSSFTLSATINPDFGQVEVDPAVVNLSAFETFFAEKRPFFVEGGGLLGFGSFSCFTCSNVSSMSLFYSRRVGRRPQGQVPFATRYQEVPENSTILGAAKLTGRLRNGLEIGVLDAVTAPQQAHVVNLAGDRLTREVEPLTNFFVGRVRKSYRGGNATIGAIGTSVARRFAYDSLGLQLPAHAEAAGVDWNLYWSQRKYRLMGNFAVTNVSGDPAAILRLQHSSARYFQRPDREHGGNGLFSNRYDPTLTSLRGYGGYLRVSQESGPLVWEAQTNFRSPGFEANDAAFLPRADYVWMLGNVHRRWTRPTPLYRIAAVTAGAQQQYNFDGDATDRQVHMSGYAELPNYWSGGFYVQHRPEVYDDRATRGGAVVRRAALSYGSVNASTDSRKPLYLGGFAGLGRIADGGRFLESGFDLRYRPAPNVTASIGPSYSLNQQMAQFVTAFADPAADHFFGRRAVFAELRQQTLSMNARVNVTFSPTLSLETFVQPFVSAGEYRDFKEYLQPRTRRMEVFGPDRLTPQHDEAGRVTGYLLDADGDPQTAAVPIGNPDFNVRSLRGNAVLRWEYRPGSTLFFVWQQQRRGSEPFGDFSLGRDAGAIFQQPADNVFVVKATYWLGR